MAAVLALHKMMKLMQTMHEERTGREEMFQETAGITIHRRRIQRAIIIVSYLKT